MERRHLAATSLLIGAAAVAGYYVGRSQGREEIRSASAPAMALRPTAPRQENADRGPNRAGARQTLPAAPSETRSVAESRRAEVTPIEALQVLADLQQRKLVRPLVTVLDRKGKLDDSFANLFALTPDERGRLQHSIDDIRDRLAGLERANATLSRDERGNIVVTVQPFPREGGKLYDDMMQQFADILGPERNDVYRKIGAEQFEASLGKFGAADRTYTFGYDPTEHPRQPYTFQDKVVQRSPEGGVNSNTNNTRFQTYDDLVARVGPVVSILPPDYRRSQ